MWSALPASILKMIIIRPCAATQGKESATSENQRWSSSPIWQSKFFLHESSSAWSNHGLCWALQLFCLLARFFVFLLFLALSFCFQKASTVHEMRLKHQKHVISLTQGRTFPSRRETEEHSCPHRRSHRNHFFVRSVKSFQLPCPWARHLNAEKSVNNLQIDGQEAWSSKHFCTRLFWTEYGVIVGPEDIYALAFLRVKFGRFKVSSTDLIKHHIITIHTDRE